MVILEIIKKQEVLGKDFKIYGDFENPLFLAKDVAEWIEHSNSRAMLQKLDDGEKVVNNVYTLGGAQESWFLTEDGLYEVLMQSRKPIAKQFKREVKKILRTIRKTGGYVSNPHQMVNTYFSTLPDEQKSLVEGLLTQIGNQQKQIEEQKPLITFAETCLKSKDNILVRQLAKIAKDEGLEIGEKRLYNRLRDWGLVMRNSTEPYQTAMENGIFVVEEKSYDTPYGTRLGRVTKVTPKGQVYIIEKLKKEIA